MKWIAEVKEPRSLYCVIQDKGTPENPGLFYLYIYENGRCIWDDLQDSLEITQNISFRDFGVPKNAWVRVKKACGKMKT